MTVPLLIAIVLGVLILVVAAAIGESHDSEDGAFFGLMCGVLIVLVLGIVFAIGSCHGEQAATGQTLSIGAPKEAKQ